MNKFKVSKKLSMVLVAMAINAMAYYTEVQYLYSFVTPEHINAFIGLSRDFHWVTASILLAYLGVQGTLDWRHNSSTAISQAANFVSEKIDKKEVVEQTITYKNAKEEDYSLEEPVAPKEEA
jgi:hypothetical protein